MGEKQKPKNFPCRKATYGRKKVRVRACVGSPPPAALPTGAAANEGGGGDQVVHFCSGKASPLASGGASLLASGDASSGGGTGLPAESGVEPADGGHKLVPDAELNAQLKCRF